MGTPADPSAPKSPLGPVEPPGERPNPDDDLHPVRGQPRLPPGFSVETSIRRDRQGRWFHEGEPIDHEGVSRSFDMWVERHENGRYVLKNKVNWAFVEIEGAPIFVRRVEVGDHEVRLVLSDGRREPLRGDTVRSDRDGGLYCQVRHGRLTAQFSRQAMFDLEPVLDQDDVGIVLRLGDVLVHPTVTDSPIE